MRFGPFVLDERTWSVSRDGVAVDLSPRLVEMLGFLVARSGTIVTKNELLERFWPEVFVAENTVTRAIADIRKAIGDDAAKPSFLQTVARRGYRFVGPPASSEDVFAAWVKGRLALDPLELERLPEAVDAFERAVEELPSYAPAYAGLANAYLLTCEGHRARGVIDGALLSRALDAARRACSLDPNLGEGWAVLGHLLAVAERTDESHAAARRACALEPNNWRHHYRLAFATWGEDRLRAVDRVLALMPGCAAAHLLSAMVFVARGTLDHAEHEAERGAVAQRRQQRDKTPLPAAGLHWLRGLVLNARGDSAAALASFDEEIAQPSHAHVYAREFAVNARVAVGFIQLARSNLAAAEAAFREVLVDAPNQARSLLGLGAAVAQRGDVAESNRLTAAIASALTELRESGRRTEATLVEAGDLTVRGRSAEAVTILAQLLNTAPPGRCGWMIAIDPMLAGLRHAHGLPALLATVAARAA